MPQAEIQLDDLDSLIIEILVASAVMRMVLPDFPDLDVPGLWNFQVIYDLARLWLVFGLFVVARHHGPILRFLGNFSEHMLHDVFGFFPLFVCVHWHVRRVERTARRVAQAFLEPVDMRHEFTRLINIFQLSFFDAIGEKVYDGVHKARN